MASDAIQRLSREDLPRDTHAMASFLIGKVLVVQQRGTRISGRIVETEAYPPGDAAGRAFTGKSQANRSLYLDYGHAFVYLIYGLYYMFNIVSEGPGIGAAVLLRALEPLEGVGLMAERRGTIHIRDLSRGPGRLSAALDIDRRYDGLDLFGTSELWLEYSSTPVASVAAATRIGLTKEIHHLWRYYELGNSFVSGLRGLTPPASMNE